MAGDWIKMRNELWTHPKFIALANYLTYSEGENVGMLTYACGDLGLDAFPRTEKTPSQIALQGITRRALRDVTMCALLRVWCAVNAHCKVVENDAVCNPMGLADLDEIAGFDGFGEALAIVGWVAEDSSADALIFKNFLEFNEPYCLRKKPAKSNAERQAEYRARKGVTKSNESNAREEKRREEINTSVSHDKIVFDGSRFQNLNGHMTAWASAYPAIDVEAEVAKAAAWLVSNPKNKKSNYARFLNGWLSRAQDRAPRVEDQPVNRFAGSIN